MNFWITVFLVPRIGRIDKHILFSCAAKNRRINEKNKDKNTFKFSTSKLDWNCHNCHNIKSYGNSEQWDLSSDSFFSRTSIDRYYYQRHWIMNEWWKSNISISSNETLSKEQSKGVRSPSATLRFEWLTEIHNMLCTTLFSSLHVDRV